MKYWSDRFINQQIALYDKSLADIERELAKLYQQTLRALRVDIVSLYDEIQHTSADQVLVSDLYRYNRYYDLINNINRELNKMGQKELPILEDRLVSFYEANTGLIDTAFGMSAVPNTQSALLTVNSIWCNDGLMWSDRVWKDKEKLAVRLEQGLVDAVARGLTPDALTKQLISDFGVSFANASRLARTELAHIQNQSALDRYARYGIKHYRFMAILDDKTCDECQTLNDQVFPIEDTAHIPPLHPNSRSTIIPVVEV